MQRRNYLTCATILFGLVYAAFLLTGCSGGGSSSAGVGDTAVGGNVALFLSDGPADEYDYIWAGVKSVYLIPAGDGNPVPIFQSPHPLGKEVDLLELRDQKLLLSVKKKVPPGVYSKIRLIITYIRPEGGTGPCTDTDLEIKLPSGKIDLNPRENFEVVRGETLAISLDMDMDKSIQFKQAGNSGKCIFRPVIFVDIETVITPGDCPQVLSGQISELFDDNGNITGFELNLEEGQGMLDVILNSETVIFDQDGERGDRYDLAEGQIVQVRGRLNADGDFEASVIIIGGVEKFKGTVTSSTDVNFTLQLDNDAGDLVVDLTQDTVIFIGCDQPYDGIIPEGWTARVFGKFDSSDTPNAFRALVVFLKPKQLSGVLTDIDRAVEDDGYDLTIKIDETTTEYVFLPDNALVKLKGDGEIDIVRLSDWVNCQGREVEVVLEPIATDPPTAKKLVVLPDEISGTVSDKDYGNMILYTTADDIAVEENATIFRVKNDQYKLLEFEDINIGEEFTAYGITACIDPEDTFADFYAFVIQLGD